MVHEIQESLNIIKDKMEEQIIIMEDVEVEPPSLLCSQGRVW